MRDRLPGSARATFGCVVLLTVAGVVPKAEAQPGFDVQIFTPSAGRSSAITIPDPQLPAHGTLLVGIGANYASQPLTRTIDCRVTNPGIPLICQPGTPSRAHLVLVSAMTQLEVSLALALFDALQLGLVMPGALSTVTRDLEQPVGVPFSDQIGLGDLRISVDAPIIAGGTAVLLRLLVSLPTGEEATLASAHNWTATPAVVMRQRLGSAKLSLAVGYRMRERVQRIALEQDDELDLAIGATVPIVSLLDLRAELRARIGVGGQSMSAAENPVEADAALGLHVSSGLSIVLGGGATAWPGQEGYGGPAFRLFGLLRWEFQPVPCRFGPEDPDGWQDGDFCRDPDNDQDDLPDAADTCPNDSEDRDGFEDDDGCPDSDNDADGLLDAADKCPKRSEDRDGWQDEDGCPEPDNDRDGLLDALDGCPLDPEDRDRFEDEDGCPEPGPTPVSVSVVEQRILVSERIYFDDDRDTIRDVSRPVLDEVAAVIRGLRSALKVIVEGHTDDTGNPAYNLDLSHRRARAVVEYLRARAVPPERLDYVGYGGTRPLGPNDSPEGRALNRRVEFTLAR